VPEITTPTLQKMADIVTPRCSGCGEAATRTFTEAGEGSPSADFCDACVTPEVLAPATLADLDHAVELREILAAL
jgi:hypothetical protein